jgi:N-methylhydantoinase A
MQNRLGVDIGGTFTDAALESGERRFSTKVLTIPSAPERSVLLAIEAVLGQATLPSSALSHIIHGTTLATNALIERKGARTALITTHGFRDTIEIRHENRFEQYDVGIELPPPLVPRRLRFPVRERIDARGRVLIALDEGDVVHAMDEIERQGVEAVAVGLLHSFTEQCHEQRIAALIAERLPELPVTLSCEVSPEMREYERFSTACANAYLQPRMASYLGNLRRGLSAAGINCPLLMMLSGGGLTTVETAARFPVRLVESGPAGGAIFASHIARQCDLQKVISFDMGGTTAKICLIDEFKPQTNRVFEVARAYRFKKGSGLPLRVPVIEMVEIGAGGGSIARVDELKRIRIGPDSAGAEPGPACYGRGGSEPTVTDADVELGRIDPAAFSGGRITLDPAAARAALERSVGEPLGLPAPLAALGVSEMVDENMSSAARVHAVESGKDTSSRVLIAFGGAAPLHAVRVAEKLGIDRIVIPTGAGVGSAIGFLRAPISYEIVRSRLVRISAFNSHEINRLFGEMHREAETIVRSGAPDAPLNEARHAFMRYQGQGHEVMVPLSARSFADTDAATLAHAFEISYRALYSRTIPGVDIEVVSWMLSLSAPVEAPREAPSPIIPYSPQPTGNRTMLDAGGEAVEASFYHRHDLRPGARMSGPAIITEDETSTVISRGFEAQVNGFGDLELRRRD